MAEAQQLKDASLNYYQPVNQQQREFHASLARHKLMIGGYGGGKTYPTIHDFLTHCLRNPGHEALACRNTWDVLEEELQEDILRICRKAGLIKKWLSDKHDLWLPNDCKIMFRPLTMKKANFKGMHLCTFYIDDPDTKRFHDTISFLWSRLRDPPDVKAIGFKSYITSNWEGRDWLWKTFMRNRVPGGDGGDLIERRTRTGTKMVKSGLAYWICPTDENPTLPENYIDDMAVIHSEAWMDRYVYCDLNSNIGIIYYSFDPKIHHMDASEVLKKPNLIKILALDVGITHATCIHKMATDGKAIYVYDEWFKRGQETSDVGEKMTELLVQDIYYKNIIDPSSAKTEQGTGMSFQRILKKDFHIHTLGANNRKLPGIQVIRDLLKSASGDVRFFIDCKRCPNLRKQMDTYHWKEPTNMDYDDMDYTEEPVDKDNDAVDTTRYGVMFLKKFLRIFKKEDKLTKIVRRRNRGNVVKNLPFYKKNPGYREEYELQETYRQLGFSEKKIRNLLSKK